MPSSDSGGVLRFSVIIPAFDCGEQLAVALESVCAQPGDDYELLVVDDGSLDGPERWVEPWSQRYPGRVRLLGDGLNRGPAGARNLGGRAARGDYLYYLDCDDRLLPTGLERFREELARVGEVALLQGGYLTTTGGETRQRSPARFTGDGRRDFARFIGKRAGGIPQGSFVVRRVVWERLGGYPERLRNNEDVVFLAQVIANYRVVSFSAPVVEIRLHPAGQRHNLAAIRATGMAMVEALFDPAKLPEELFGYRTEFMARRALSLFRSFHLGGAPDEARAMYRLAFGLRPGVALRWGYLSKYLRLVVGNLIRRRGWFR